MSSFIWLIFLFVIVFFVWILFFNKNYEGFSSYGDSSEGYFLITWEKPQDSGGSDSITYDITIAEKSTGTKIVDQKGLVDLSYQFSDYKWNTEYVVNVYAVNETGEGNPATLDFDSGGGPFPPNKGDTIQLYGYDAGTGFIIDGTAGKYRLPVGSSFNGLSISLMIETIEEAQRIISGEEKLGFKITLTNKNNSDTCVWTVDPEISTIVAYGVSDSSLIASDVFDVGPSIKTPCTTYQTFSSITGTRCSCPVIIKAGDTFKIDVNVFDKLTGKIVPIGTQSFSFSGSSPSEPQDLKQKWVSVESYQRERPTNYYGESTNTGMNCNCTIGTSQQCAGIISKCGTKVCEGNLGKCIECTGDQWTNCVGCLKVGYPYLPCYSGR